MINYISQLDTERFGFKIAKINNFNENPGILYKEMKKMDVKLIISKISSSEIHTINALEELGFRIKDMQVKYRYDIHQLDFTYEQLPKNFNLREATPHDVAQLVSIAEESFMDYGHYFANHRLDKTKCLEIYKDWTRRSCLNKDIADKFFLAEKDNTIMGYLSFKIFASEGIDYAAGVIGAVSKKFREQDVFPSLVKIGLLWGAELNLKWEEHNVLTTNFPSNRSFTKVGFRIVDSFITLHCWLDQ
ncbi:MAG: hypothetical protein GTO45_02450 [Candidatus Aminicenantes bacterium]|nr:hypothetical protein [Candidatus Aminicenantes bacterium]NIM77590.1 hypothetical protein [Candidatus Aminicenantes bacterium]NIN16904.1 hypothetical protein [Candidatus Aminicenantes bacterium]NIN40797.1 hypothetical protein [Candidatus Aminicenantes bacterium]NIN83601.1 hypothetical protein [Candidatus Aminicenantes bacterium]